MDEKLEGALAAFRAVAGVEILAGATPDDVAGALLELGAEVALAEYGRAQVAGLLHRLARVLETAE